jgi:hypothetical protein
MPTHLRIADARGRVLVGRISDFVGHSSTYMVDRYRHLLDDQREGAGRTARFLLAGPKLGLQARKPALPSGRH